MTVEGREPIARGRTAEIYAWKPGRVIKLFNKSCTADMVEREAASSIAVLKAGMPSPAIEGIVEVVGRLGIVMEKVDGDILGDLLLATPWNLNRYGRIMAEMHVKMHACEAGELPSFREKLVGRIETLSFLSSETKMAVLGLIDRLPDGNSVCHGDFYCDNLMLTSERPVIIDWYGAGRGNPLADVARTWLLHRLAEWPFSFPKRLFIDPMRILFHRAYMKRYLQLMPGTMEEIRKWLIPVMAARLAENVEEEQERFVRTIDNYFAG